VTEPTLAFGRSATGIDFGASDGPADLIFLIAAPAGADDAHLTILSSLARQLMNAEFTGALRSVGDAAAAAALIRGDAPAADAAAESLESAGREAGVEVVVEPPGSAGFTRLGPAVIAAADGVIFAHDVPVREKERFAGKPTVDVGVKAGINRPGELITEVRGKAARGQVTAGAPSGSGTPVERAGDAGEGYGTKLRKWLMSGVSYMVP